MITAANINGTCESCGYEHKENEDALVFGFNFKGEEDGGYKIVLCEDCLRSFVAMGIDCLGGKDEAGL